MTLTFDLVTATTAKSFNKRVNQRLAEGWKFMSNMPVVVTRRIGRGRHYSIPMLLEEQDNA